MDDDADRSDCLRRWQRMSLTARFENFYRAVHDVHRLRLRCSVLTGCVGRLYDARSEDDRFDLVLEARDANDAFVTSFERDGVALRPVVQAERDHKRPRPEETV
jgi:hypothetical protein